MYPKIWDEVQRIARASGTGPTLDLRPLIDLVCVRQDIDQLGLRRVLDEVGLKRALDEIGAAELVSLLSRSPINPSTPVSRVNYPSGPPLPS